MPRIPSVLSASASVCAAHAAAHGAAGPRRVADERRVGRPALGAAREVRQVARQPEQLQLEGERERVERGPLRRVRRLVEQVEEARQRGERALVRLLLGEQAQHRLGADQAGGEPVVVVACRLVRPDELDAGDRLQLAGALMEHELDVRERLEPAAEAGRRLADTLRNGSDAAALERVQVEDAVGLAEADRPEHDGLGLVRAAHDVRV